MRLTVTKLLNKRIGTPSLNALKGNPLEIGEEIVVVEKVKGDSYDGNDVWYKDDAGNYYWSGGFADRVKIFPDLQTPLLNDKWWLADFGFPEIWHLTKGENVKVAVIDSGLNYNHPNIKNKNNISYFNVLLNSTKQTDCLDTSGHGTQCAGMIAAHGPEVYGVAPAVDLLIIKADTDGNMKCENVAAAIDYAVEAGAEIISISCYYGKKEKKLPLLEKATHNAYKKNVLIVASTGNAGTVFNSYPASYRYALAVGASQQGNSLWAGSTLNENTDILAPGANIVLMDLQGIKTDNGTSYSAPYAAATCALLLAYLKKTNQPGSIDFLKNWIKENASNKPEITREVKQLHNFMVSDLGIISPSKILNTLQILIA